MLEVRGLRVRRGARALLDGVELDVAAGELVAIVGANGAGKSTLLRAVSGEWPFEGSVRIDHRALGQWSRAELARAMAVLPQHATLGFDFTVQEVIELGRLPHRREAARANRDAVAGVIGRLGLEAFRERSYLSLSGGERQRVQFARVVAQLMPPGAAERRLLLLDEPTSALDLAQQRALLDLCRVLCAEGVAVLAIMHDLNLAARYADRLVMLGAGRLLAAGTPASMITDARIAEAFACPVSVAPAALDGRPYVLVRPGTSSRAVTAAAAAATCAEGARR